MLILLPISDALQSDFLFLKTKAPYTCYPTCWAILSIVITFIFLHCLISHSLFHMPLSLLCSTFSNCIRFSTRQAGYLSAAFAPERLARVPAGAGTSRAASVLGLPAASLRWWIPFSLTLASYVFFRVIPSFWWSTSSSGFLRKDVQEVKVSSSCMAENVFILHSHLANCWGRQRILHWKNTFSRDIEGIVPVSFSIQCYSWEFYWHSDSRIFIVRLFFLLLFYRNFRYFLFIFGVLKCYENMTKCKPFFFIPCCGQALWL